MGYTAGKTELMIGLGMSSISDSWYAFAQNEKTIDAEYLEKINQGYLDFIKTHHQNHQLIIDVSDRDFVSNPEDYQWIIKKIALFGFLKSR